MQTAEGWRIEEVGGGPVGAACYMTALQTTCNQTTSFLLLKQVSTELSPTVQT